MAFIFKIQIRGITKPPVWRRLVIPETFSFHQLHLVIQDAFGWYNCHLYEFTPKAYSGGLSIQLPHEESEPEEKDSRETKLNEYFEKEGDQLVYVYDFGDSWEHSVVLEEIEPQKLTTPSCTGGKGKCPPEDCGGYPGYQNFLQIVNDPNDPEYEEMREWAGLLEEEKWDPNEFDLAETNEILGEEEYQ